MFNYQQCRPHPQTARPAGDTADHAGQREAVTRVIASPAGNMPRVSVIMPVYNTREEYLRESIESILGQTFTDFEFIVVDNGSDAYVAMCLASYTDERLRVLRLEENQGPARARNIGIENARGEFIAFTDSDDISLPRRFEKQLDFLGQHPEIGCLGTSARIVGSELLGASAPAVSEDGAQADAMQQHRPAFHRLLRKKSHRMTFPMPREHGEIELFLILVGCVFCHSSVMVRKSIIDDNQVRYRPEYVPAEDYVLWLDMVGKTRFAVMEDVMVLYRYYEDNISCSQRNKQREKAIAAQFRAFAKYCNLSFKSKRLWLKFINGIPLTREESEEFVAEVSQIMDALVDKNYHRQDILALFKKTLKKIYYRTHTFKGQWALLCSPLNRLFNVKLSWRLFCLITRGVF